MLTRTKDKTRTIIQELLAEAERIRQTNAVDRGFRSRLARKYGVSRGRITNIARQHGLTEAKRGVA